MRINTHYALLFGLVFSFNAHAGVTDGGVTAFSPNQLGFIIFTDDPADDPAGPDAPLGVAWFNESRCDSDVFGEDLVEGLHCSGTEGDPISAYTCEIGQGAISATDTLWCLFSENPRSGNRAWAIKYVNGLIPTNTGTSIVRCGGRDTFDSVNGCHESPPSQIGIEGGFIKLDTTDGINPLDRNCAETAHNGRMVVDDVNDLLYICTANGWISK